MTEVSDSVLEKISALLRMAEHPNSNENEAALALERAQALLLKYNLDRSEIGQGKQSESLGIVKDVFIEPAEFYQARKQLLHTIAKNNLCKVVGSPLQLKSTLFGSAANIKMVRGMYEWVGEQLDRMVMLNMITYAQGVQQPNYRTYWISFYLGACETINVRLQKGMDTFKYGSGRDLVPMVARDLDRAARAEFPYLVKGRANYGRENYDGAAAGRRAGNDVTFSRTGQIGGTRALGSGR